MKTTSFLLGAGGQMKGAEWTTHRCPLLPLYQDGHVSCDEWEETELLYSENCLAPRGFVTLTPSLPSLLAR
jgi:hypothetical protein